MKAMMSTEPGGPQSLTLMEVDTPQPAKGQVRIAVKAAGVNFPDTLIIRDLYQFKPSRPFAPGCEIAGIVDAIGEGVDHVAIGDRVMADETFGGYATHLIAEATNVRKIPDAMPFEEAAAFMLTYATSHYALKDRAALREGESLFIIGAAGGVGAAAIELGKAMGARVIAGVSSADKAAFCKELGADETIIYPTGSLDKAQQKELSAAIKTACGSDGVDVIYDAVGGDYAEAALRAIAWNGRFLVVGFPAGIPKIPLNLPLLKGCQIVGVFWGGFTARQPETHNAYVEELFQWYEQGKIHPRVTKTFPLEQAADALIELETRKALGKIVLTIAE